MKGKETGLSVLAIRVQGHKAREMLKKKEANSGKIPKQERMWKQKSPFGTFSYTKTRENGDIKEQGEKAKPLTDETWL